MISKEFKEQLKAIVGTDNVDDSNSGRTVYSYDATPKFQALPDIVVAPPQC